MSVFPIRLYGDPVLRARARPVEEVDDDLRALADDMIETMQAAEGVGLAANQVGELKRILVVDFEPIVGEKRTEAFINPEIVFAEGKFDSEEGCLSLPGISCRINRKKRLTVRATGLDG